MNTATNGIAVYAGRLVLGGENDLAGVGKISWRQQSIAEVPAAAVTRGLIGA
jgi:hypothetical protein